MKWLLFNFFTENNPLITKSLGYELIRFIIYRLWLERKKRIKSDRFIKPKT